MRARRSPWPASMGPNTAHDRARTVARAAYALARKHAPAGDLATFEAMCRAVGEAGWLLPSAATRDDTAWLTRDDVASRGGVRPDVVSGWAGRGLTRQGETRHLSRHPEGYHPDEVTDFLRWRDTAPRTRTPEKGSRACTTRPHLSSPARPACAAAAADSTTSTQTAG